MRSVRYHDFGGLEQLRVDEMPEPDPAPGEVLVRLVRAGVSPLDDKIRSGVLPSSNQSCTGRAAFISFRWPVADCQ